MENKIAIISDIHGNSWALEAVLKDIDMKGIQSIFDLGDSLFGPLDIKNTFRLIQKRKIKSILGNQDRLIIEKWNKKITRNPTLRYVISQIDKEIYDWLSGLPSTRSIGDTFFICHGTPYNDEEYLISMVENENIKTRLADDLESDTLSISQKIILCGHDHTPKTIRIEGSKVIVNPGSVGLQAYKDTRIKKHIVQTCNPFAKYCIIEYDENACVIEHISVFYDWEKAARFAEMNNRPDWAKWIRTGTV